MTNNRIILDTDNWIRQGPGKIFRFMASDEEIVDILQASLPSQFAPYSILGTFMVKEGKNYKPSCISVDLPEFLQLRTQGIWQFFLQSHQIMPNLPIKDGLSLDRLLACNGAINLQQGRLSKGIRQTSSIGLVDKLKNINTGELLAHKDSLKIFNALKKGICHPTTHGKTTDKLKLMNRISFQNA